VRLRLLVALVAFPLAACGHASATTHAAPSSASYADQACPAALAAVPSAPPRTVSDAGADIQTLQGIGTKGTFLWTLITTVSADMLNL
jgi:hypothetical protein